jgi:hypothetical protein
MKKSRGIIQEECLIEMFRRVGEKYPNKELTNNSEWYTMRSWTVKQEENFKKWMIRHLRVSGKFMKQEAIMMTSFFLLQYGWTTKKPSQIKIIKQ